MEFSEPTVARSLSVEDDEQRQCLLLSGTPSDKIGTSTMTCEEAKPPDECLDQEDDVTVFGDEGEIACIGENSRLSLEPVIEIIETHEENGKGTELSVIDKQLQKQLSGTFVWFLVV